MSVIVAPPRAACARATTGKGTNMSDYDDCDWQDVAQAILDKHEADLTENQSDFLEDMTEREHEPTEAQMEWLLHLAQKYSVEIR